MSRQKRLKVVVVALVLAIAVAAVLVRVLREDGPGSASAGTRSDVPAAPADLGTSGSWTETRVRASGDVAVRTWIRSETPVTVLDLITPDPDSLPGTVEARKVLVSTMDGARLAARRAVGTKVQRVRLREPATDLFLSYTIAGETVSGEASTVAGRALVRVTSMDVSYEGETGSSVRVLSGPGQVLNAACLPADAGYDVAPSACGAPDTGGTWKVVLRGAARHSRVLAQLDETS